MITVSQKAIVAAIVVGGMIAVGLLFAMGIANVRYGGIHWPDYAPLVIVGLWTVCAGAVGLALRLIGKA